MATWDAEGSFLVIGDSLGTLHFLDVVNRSLVFSQQISKPPQQQMGDDSDTTMANPSASSAAAAAARAFVNITLR